MVYLTRKVNTGGDSGFLAESERVLFCSRRKIKVEVSMGSWKWMQDRNQPVMLKEGAGMGKGIGWRRGTKGWSVQICRNLKTQPLPQSSWGCQSPTCPTSEKLLPHRSRMASNRQMEKAFAGLHLAWLCGIYTADSSVPLRFSSWLWPLWYHLSTSLTHYFFSAFLFLFFKDSEFHPKTCLFIQGAVLRLTNRWLSDQYL